MRALPGLTLQATTARDETSTHLYRLDLDTAVRAHDGRGALEQPRHRRGGAELRHRPGHGQWTARRADEHRRHVRRGDRLRRISRTRRARERRCRHGRQPSLVQRLPLAIRPERGPRRSRRQLSTRPRVDQLRAPRAAVRARQPVAGRGARSRRPRDPAQRRAAARRAAAHAVVRSALRLASRPSGAVPRSRRGRQRSRRLRQRSRSARYRGRSAARRFPADAV